MFEAIDYLQNGNTRQQQAHQAIQRLQLLEALREYQPALCGTIPIGIDIASSDIDIIMEVHDHPLFAAKIKALYSDQIFFTIKGTPIRGKYVTKANFRYQGFDVELFGQQQPVQQQHAYRHMVIEKHLLDQHPTL
ncbi:DUF4269 domain-containing protein [Gracilibacillus timonensis]|uniref:DUF4269 domain-containing protein n=1 Tax=Gracilibacillus timonensis TaxID=1816696 RepID=UPI000AA13380|nr:DUF4269 domain-containing protein [Gracilibacillus timonensis]